MTYSEYGLKFVGCREGDSRHHFIIDCYNKMVTPLPRNYKVTYRDSWCATFVSYILVSCGAVNPPIECSCYYMREKARKNNQIVASPRVNDIVMYDWDGNTSPDHVGIITGIRNNVLTVVEGNYNDSVKIRKIPMNSKFINCYIRVPQKTVKKEITEKLVSDVIKGKYGNNPERKKLLTELGYDYSEVQKEVNKCLKVRTIV